MASFFLVKIICSNDVSGCIPSLHSPNLNFCWWGKYTWDSNLTNWFLQFQSIGLTGVSFKTTFGREVATCHSWSQWRVWIRLSYGAIAEVIVDNVSQAMIRKEFGGIEMLSWKHVNILYSRPIIGYGKSFGSFSICQPVLFACGFHSYLKFVLGLVQWLWPLQVFSTSWTR